MKTKQIWKYPLTQETNVIQMPSGAKILSAQIQHGHVQLWALVEPKEPKVNRILLVLPTGQDIVEETLNSLEYISTVQISGGTLIYHIFESIPF